MSELDIPADVTGDVVTFRLDGEVLAVAAGRLREVLEKVRVTRVPGAPDFASGVINVRGSVVPLADLRVPLRMPRPAEQVAAMLSMCLRKGIFRHRNSIKGFLRLFVGA